MFSYRVCRLLTVTCSVALFFSFVTAGTTRAMTLEDFNRIRAFRDDIRLFNKRGVQTQKRQRAPRSAERFRPNIRPGVLRDNPVEASFQQGRIPCSVYDQVHDDVLKTIPNNAEFIPLVGRIGDVFLKVHQMYCKGEIEKLEDDVEQPELKKPEVQLPKLRPVEVDNQCEQYGNPRRRYQCIEYQRRGIVWIGRQTRTGINKPVEKTARERYQNRRRVTETGIDNQCDEYFSSRRRAQCRVYERRGIKWLGGQTRD